MVPCDFVTYGIVLFLIGLWVAERVVSLTLLLRFVSRVGLWVSLAAAIPIYFEASNVVMRAMIASNQAVLYDDVFLGWDEMLLGKVFPRGQLALWLDTNAWLGPNTLLGMLMCEVLQVAYASYYVWGNGLGIWLMLNYLKDHRHLSQQQDDFQWHRLQMYISAWSGGFLFNFILNAMFPAVSPRIYLADVYQHELQGIWLANILRGGLANAAANSYSAFPSGHCGLSWLAVILAYRLGYMRYARVALIVGLLITLATQVLRYHYFVDLLCATLLVSFATIVGGFERQAQTEYLLKSGIPTVPQLSAINLAVDSDEENEEQHHTLLVRGKEARD